MALPQSTGTLGITEDHRDLRDAVRAFVQRHVDESVVRAAVDADSESVPDLLARLSGEGLLGLHLPEEHGGAGAGLLETAVVLEELGRAMTPGPVLPSVLVSAVLHRAGHTEHLAGLAEGDTIAGVALQPGTLAGNEEDGGIRVRGVSAPALSARVASLLLLPVAVGETTRWVVVAADDVDVLDHPPGLDRTRRVADVRLDLLVPAADVLDVDPRLPLDLAATLFAAEASGVADWATWTAAEYARIRHQFGRPIGQFQGVKHRCARMLAAAEQGRVCAWDAARAMDTAHESEAGEPSEASLAAAVAGAVSVDAALSTALDCIDTLGGIGFTWEHDASLYLRRAQTLRLLLGDSAAWRRRVADLTLDGVRRAVALELPADAERVRSEIRTDLDPARGLPEADRAGYLAERGYTAPHLPEPWGKAADAVTQLVIAEELRAAGLRPHDMVIGGWVVPTLVQHGSEAQQQRFIPPSLRGDLVWCQLFSEPGAGSDLAGLRTRAVKVDGGWRVSGQKVWTSMAREADVGILLARTDPDAPRHRGISYFLLDMASDGIDVRPLRELTGEALFNEVFLDDVFIPDDMLVGEPGDGWRMARTTLANERVALSAGSSLGDGGERLLDLLAGSEPDAERRTRLGSILCDAQSSALFSLRATLRSVSGAQPGSESSVAKLVGVAHTQEVWRTAVEWQGPSALHDADERGSSTWWLLSSRNLSIAGGTTDVQLNIIGERVLGLPREPEPAR